MSSLACSLQVGTVSLPNWGRGLHPPLTCSWETAWPHPDTKARDRQAASPVSLTLPGWWLAKGGQPGGGLGVRPSAPNHWTPWRHYQVGEEVLVAHLWLKQKLFSFLANKCLKHHWPSALALVEVFNLWQLLLPAQSQLLTGESPEKSGAPLAKRPHPKQ